MRRKPRPSVLVVEDEPRLADVTTRMVKQLGYEVATVGSGESAVRSAKEGDYQVVVMDLNLPGISGLDAFEQIISFQPDTQVVMLTGFGDLDSAKRAIRLGAADFLTKPAALGDLEGAIDRAWQKLGEPEPEVDISRVNMMADPEPDDGDKSLEAIERRAILDALARHDGNRKEAAEELGISLRTLYYRIRQYQQDGWLTKD